MIPKPPWAKKLARTFSEIVQLNIKIILCSLLSFMLSPWTWKVFLALYPRPTHNLIFYHLSRYRHQKPASQPAASSASLSRRWSDSPWRKRNPDITTMNFKLTSEYQFSVMLSLSLSLPGFFFPPNFHLQHLSALSGLQHVRTLMSFSQMLNF